MTSSPRRSSHRPISPASRSCSAVVIAIRFDSTPYLYDGGWCHGRIAPPGARRFATSRSIRTTSVLSRWRSKTIVERACHRRTSEPRQRAGTSGLERQQAELVVRIQAPQLDLVFSGLAPCAVQDRPAAILGDANRSAGRASRAVPGDPPRETMNPAAFRRALARARDELVKTARRAPQRGGAQNISKPKLRRPEEDPSARPRVTANARIVLCRPMTLRL